MYEVERKFAVDSLEPIAQKLRERGAVRETEEVEVDTYFAHPARDFSTTDEALRIRRVGERGYLTYKGPKVDALTKTREEIDLELPSGTPAADDFSRLLEALGFRAVSAVRKHRQRWRMPPPSREIQVLLDDVEEVGTYVEIELLAEVEQLDQARTELAKLAADLELDRNERRSYLELKLARQG